MKNFWLAFVPMFMAVNAFSILPMFITLTEGLDAPTIRRVIVQSVITASVTALVFLAVGDFLFSLIGITVSDFMIAGGALLFIIALNNLIATTDGPSHLTDTDSLGAVPLGVPLIVGPAVLTTIFLLIGQYGVFITIAATVANILIAGVLFWFSGPLIRLLGKAGAKTISKLGDLILAAFAVMLIRNGIVTVLTASGIAH